MRGDRFDDRIHRIVERAKAYTTDPSAPKKHHFVPRSYLARFAVNGQVRRTLVDTGQQRNLGLKGVGYLEDFYRLEAPDIDPDRTPPLFTEVLLGALEDDAKRDIDTLLLYEPGIITNSSMITDMSFYLAAQHVRGRAFREEQEVLIQWSDTQDPIELSTILARFHLVLTGGNPDDEALVAARAEQIRSTQPISADLKAQALQLMLQQWFPLVLTFAGLKWAIYHTEAPLLTSDEPVVLIGTPGTDRTEKPGLLTTGVVVFPISPDRLLTLFNPALMPPPRYPFILTASEVDQINAELMATAEREVYERPSDRVAAAITVPSRITGKPLVDPERKVLTRYRKPTRWASVAEPPAPPIPRWFQPEDWGNPSSGTGCQVPSCGHGVDIPVQLPELVEHVKDNPFSYYESYAYVCADHYKSLRAELDKSVPRYTVDLRWRNPDTNRRELRIRYPEEGPG